MQGTSTEINEKIGAAGVVSQECKTVVSQYGQQILDLLLEEVCVMNYGFAFLVAGLVSCF